MLEQRELLEKILMEATRNPTRPIKETIDSLLESPQPEPEPAPVESPTKLSDQIRAQIVEAVNDILNHPAALQEQERRIAVPYGYAMPADNEPDLALQYAEAVGVIEGMQRITSEMYQNWRELVIRPATPEQFSLLALSLLKEIVGETRGQLSIDVPKVSIPRYLAELAGRIVQPGSDLDVAHGEYAEWSIALLRAQQNVDERARIIMSNLRAVGLVD